MTNYMLTIVGDDDAYRALTPDARTALHDGHMAFAGALVEAGVTIVAGAELDAPDTARTLNSSGLVTDGPYGETKERIGGFYVIDVPTIEEAVEWARRIPLLTDDVIEVRATK